jgi:D-alanyl-D-alanine carboxypeptidase/D-alanyl-D-alanine-endopeptidase (penicillin-binding protein 4)
MIPRLALVAALLLPLTSPAAPAPAPAPFVPLLSVRRVAPWVESTIAAQRLAGSLAPIVGTTLDGGGGVNGCVEVVQGGSTLYQRHADAELLPASNMKLLTSTAVLDVLGPDYRFTTTVRAMATPRGGVLRGNLYLVGGGDPYLMTRAYDAQFVLPEPTFTSVDQLAASVRAAGITTIVGSVVGDGSRYDNELFVPSWLPIYRSEGDVGSLSALEVNDGTPPQTTPTKPQTTPTTTQTTPTTTAKPPPPPPPNPDLYAAATLTNALRAAGVVVTGSASTGTAPASAAPVASIQSAPVSQQIGQMLRVSDDTAAELLVKELGYVTAHSGSTQSGEAAVRRDLAADGLPVGQFIGIDGSGLDRGDRATCTLLIAALERAGTSGPLAAGLPVAHQTGTLTWRLAGTPAVGRLHGKTGSLADVSALSGYITASPGAVTPGLAEPVYFSIIIDGMPNGVSVGLVDRIAAAVAAYPSVVPLAQLEPKAS